MGSIREQRTSSTNGVTVSDSTKPIKTSTLYQITNTSNHKQKHASAEPITKLNSKHTFLIAFTAISFSTEFRSYI